MKPAEAFARRRLSRTAWCLFVNPLSVSAAAGESIAAEVHENDSEESAGERRQRIAQEYGFSDDVVERYMLAFHGDESMAHRKMRATYVRLSFIPSSRSSD